jgi:hypothetical protein
MAGNAPAGDADVKETLVYNTMVLVLCTRFFVVVLLYYYLYTVPRIGVWCILFCFFANSTSLHIIIQ